MKATNEIIKMLWLLNAQINSLYEPKILAKKACEILDEFKNKCTNMKLSDIEKDLIRCEIDNAFEYVNNFKFNLEDLENHLIQIIKTI